MATNTLNTRIVVCNDTQANWATSSKVLLKGEIGVEYSEDKGPKFKIGNGVDEFGDLPYAALTPEEIESLLEEASHTHDNKNILDSITAAFTTELNTKLTGIEAGAEVNAIESVKVNNTAVSISSVDRSVNITVPTAVSELTNDSGYITSYENTTYSLEAETMVGGVAITLDSSDESEVDNTINIIGGESVSVVYSNGTISIDSTDTVYTHPTSGVTAGTYNSVTVDAYGHVTAGSNPTTLAGYGITDAALASHTHVSGDITSLDASKLTGTIDIARLPAGALERCVVVADDDARFALTIDDIQLGDTVKVDETGLMYIVIDTDNLDSEDGYTVYTSGSAASVNWANIIDKPTAFTPATHIHGIPDVSGLQDALDSKATTAQGAKADTAVQSVTLDGTELKVGTTVALPAYPTTLPASDVYAWAKAATKPEYTKSEVGLGNVDNVKQIAGKASDTVQGHIVTWGANGYTVEDSGFTIATSVPANAVFTDTTYEVFDGATEDEAGSVGLVPKPLAGEEGLFLKADGTWASPANSDTNVTNTNNNAVKAYVTGTTQSTTNTGTQVFDTNIYIDTDAGKLVATTFAGNLSGNAATATAAGKLSAAKNFSISGGATAASVAFDGTSAVNLVVSSVDAAKLVISDSDTLVLNGGSAS